MEVSHHLRRIWMVFRKLRNSRYRWWDQVGVEDLRIKDLYLLLLYFRCLLYLRPVREVWLQRCHSRRVRVHQWVNLGDIRRRQLYFNCGHLQIVSNFRINQLVGAVSWFIWKNFDYCLHCVRRSVRPMRAGYLAAHAHRLPFAEEQSPFCKRREIVWETLFPSQCF